MEESLIDVVNSPFWKDFFIVFIVTFEKVNQLKSLNIFFNTENVYLNDIFIKK